MAEGATNWTLPILTTGINVIVSPMIIWIVSRRKENREDRKANSDISLGIIKVLQEENASKLEQITAMRSELLRQEREIEYLKIQVSKTKRQSVRITQWLEQMAYILERLKVKQMRNVNDTDELKEQGVRIANEARRFLEHEDDEEEETSLD